jgi:hypothetical protein
MIFLLVRNNLREKDKSQDITKNIGTCELKSGERNFCYLNGYKIKVF